MIVNKPQFDTDNIKPGQAYWLTRKDNRGYYAINAPCIVLKVSPLEIRVSFFKEDNYDNKPGYLKEVHIPIESVVSKETTLERMLVSTLITKEEK